LKQQDDEYLLDYVKRFKQLCDVVKSQVGTGVLNNYVERQDGYKKLTTDKARQDMKKDEWGKLMAYLLMRNVDQNRYSSLMKNLSQQYSLDNDQYPKTITAATDVLSNHKLDQKYFDNNKKNVEKNK